MVRRNARLVPERLSLSRVAKSTSRGGWQWPGWHAQRTAWAHAASRVSIDKNITTGSLRHPMNMDIANCPPGPLHGIRVVDLTTVMFGPYGTQIMGEMGADVIKVEYPEGDIGRQTGAARSPGMSAAHLMKGRNKRSVVLDLKQPAGLEALERLTKTADVFVHNIRPQAAQKLGIGYDAVVAWKPDIIYAAAS